MDEVQTGFAMGIIDQEPGKARIAMWFHRNRGFSGRLIEEAMAVPVAAGAVDLVRKSPRPYHAVRSSAFSCHLSARASHETCLHFVHTA
jgi:hypothetical protein